MLLAVLRRVMAQSVSEELHMASEGAPWHFFIARPLSSWRRLYALNGCLTAAGVLWHIELCCSADRPTIGGLRPGI